MRRSSRSTGEVNFCGPVSSVELEFSILPEKGNMIVFSDAGNQCHDVVSQYQCANNESSEVCGHFLPVTYLI